MGAWAQAWGPQQGQGGGRGPRPLGLGAGTWALWELSGIIELRWVVAPDPRGGGAAPRPGRGDILWELSGII